MTDFNKQYGAEIVILYHDHCLDGYTAAWACHKGLVEKDNIPPENIILLPVQYGNLPNFEWIVAQYTHMYVVDFSLPVHILAQIAGRIHTVILDHHKTAAEMYDITGKEGNPIIHGAWIWYNVEESGASLVWKYFFGDATDTSQLIDYIRDYDLWKFELAETKAINKFLRIQPMTLQRWEKLYFDFKDYYTVEKYAEQGEAIQAYHDSIVASIVDTAETITIDGKVGLVANCSPEFASDVGHVLATRTGTFGATWQQVRDKVKYSLRSNGDYDVAVMAQIFGGGGHKNAAGFTLNNPSISEGSSGICLWTTEEGEYSGG